MSRLHRLLLTVLLAAAWSGGDFAAASTEPPAMHDLWVEGGEEAWHSSPFFQLYWDGPAVTPNTVAYRLHDSAGNLVTGPVTRTVTGHSLRVEVPAVPDAYEIEAWLLDADGEAGRRSTATLRFDDARPAPPIVEAPPRWLLGHEQAVLDIGAPPSPLPRSGIRGYVVSLNGGARSFESDEGSVWLGTLPEGTNVAQVAAISGAGVSSEVATATIRVDATRPELSSIGAPTGWSSKPVWVTAHAQDALSGMAAAGPDGPFTAIAVDGAAPARAWGDQVGAWIAGSGVHEVDLFARDAAGNVAGDEAQNPPAAIVKIDEDPPRVAFAATQDPSEPERLEAIVTDSLSGPSPHRGSIALRLAGTSAHYRQLPTEVVDGRLIARWDSDAFPHGKYEFLATGFDAAGNLGTGSSRERGAKMVLVNPVKAQVTLESGFTARRPGWQSAKRVRFGRSVRFGGRLRRLGGSPIAGQEIAVTETFGSGADARRRTTTARTGADGTFSVRLAPGPSRDVVATYPGNRALTRAIGSSARLATLASVRLRASTATADVGGNPVVFKGRVGAAGAKRAARGLPVELQFRYRGASWSEFRTVETDGRGRFRYAYRFSDDDSRGVRFQFRAHVKGREGWPYEPSASRPVQVTGR